MPEQFRNPKELKGLALPALRTQGGYFVARTKYDVAWGDVMLALFCPIGGRPGNRSFGSALHRVLFDPNVGQQLERVKYIVFETLIQWCPHVQLQDVRAKIDKKEISLTVVFSLVSDSQKQARSVLIPRSGSLAQIRAV